MEDIKGFWPQHTFEKYPYLPEDIVVQVEAGLGVIILTLSEDMGRNDWLNQCFWHVIWVEEVW